MSVRPTTTAGGHTLAACQGRRMLCHRERRAIPAGAGGRRSAGHGQWSGGTGPADVSRVAPARRPAALSSFGALDSLLDQLALARDVTIVLGALDTDRASLLLEVSPAAMAQGANRFDRDLHYDQHVRRLAPRGRASRPAPADPASGRRAHGRRRPGRAADPRAPFRLTRDILAPTLDGPRAVRNGSRV